MKALNLQLSAVQESLFASYCQSYALWRLAEEDLAENGWTIKGETQAGYEYEAARPQVGVLHKQKDAMPGPR